MHTPQTRRRLIRRLLTEQRVHSQSELGDLLAGHGIDVNQATLSRDLRELGVVKGHDGYTVPPEAPAASTDLERAIEQWLHGATAVQHQVVVHTPPGGAQPLAVAIDRAHLSGVVGTVAGDDTVLVICKDKRVAAKVAHSLRGEALTKR